MKTRDKIEMISEKLIVKQRKKYPDFYRALFTVILQKELQFFIIGSRRGGKALYVHLGGLVLGGYDYNIQPQNL